LLLAALATAVWAQQPSPDLTETSLEDLMNIEVTSVSKKEEKLFQTAAAIYVITPEDIRRSSATSIPELLRMVPGLNVARIDANKWAITARGFNGRFANKLLVMIDGRSVYTPLFSGVYWDVQDVLLEDVERIEVIRGPGATLWGANAVNGVINIITKPARETQGGLLTAGAGTEERGFGALRYGGPLGRQAHYRFYAKYFNRDNSIDTSGHRAADQWDMLRGGFRLDWKASPKDSLTFQGDIYQGDVEGVASMASLTPPFNRSFNEQVSVSGGNLLGRWSRIFSDRSDLTLQLYYDRTSRAVRLGEVRQTFDLDLQHHLALGRRHDLRWGFGHRVTSDEVSGNFTVSLDPQSRTDHLFSAFAQDELKLVRDRLRLALGTKVEHNRYTGFEVQPNLRLLWTPHEQHAWWASVSRAARTPSRVDDGFRINAAAFPGAGGMINLLSIFGNRDFKSEYLLAYETGYRAQPSKRLSLDLAAFYNVYRHLETIESGRPFLESSPAPPHLVIPLRFDNRMRGETYGLEAAAHWQATSHWKLSGSYSWLRLQLHREATSNDPEAETEEGHSPRHQFHLRSYLKLPRNFEFDTSLSRISRLATLEVPGYTRLDARLGWRLKERLELSLGLQNLLDARHREYGRTEDRTDAMQIKRSIYGKVTWRF
jgi:iron complex outermembrane receptor protein